jgi:hypothetical protein
MTLLDNKPLEEMCEVKCLGNLISPDGKKHLENNRKFWAELKNLFS